MLLNVSSINTTSVGIDGHAALKTGFIRSKGHKSLHSCSDLAYIGDFSKGSYGVWRENNPLISTTLDRSKLVRVSHVPTICAGKGNLATGSLPMLVEKMILRLDMTHQMCFTALFTAEFALRLYACESVAERGAWKLEDGGWPEGIKMT